MEATGREKRTPKKPERKEGKKESAYGMIFKMSDVPMPVPVSSNANSVRSAPREDGLNPIEVSKKAIFDKISNEMFGKITAYVEAKLLSKFRI